MRIGVNLRDKINEIMRGIPGSGFEESELGNGLDKVVWELSGKEHADAQEEDGERNEFGGRERSLRIQISSKLWDEVVVNQGAEDKHTQDHGNGLMWAHG